MAWNPQSLPGRRIPPRLPEGVRVYAVGDVHGHLDLLDQVLSHIDADLATNPTPRAVQVFLGDYIDRGPSSREVLDRLIERSSSHATVFLKGNHEACLIEFLQDPAVLAAWRELGGLQTLASYGLTPSPNPDAVEQAALAKALGAMLPESHRQFLADLKSSFRCGNFFFVHAGVKPGIPLSQQQEKHLLWIRNEFLRSEEDFGKVIVHGHTPALEPELRPNRINIDTGAYATGRLTCLKMEADRMWLNSTTSSAPTPPSRAALDFPSV